MTGPSGIIREGADPPTSRREAAGGSPAPGANAVKRRRTWRAALLALALAGVIGAGTWVLFGSPLLAVRSVIVTGTHLVPRSEVLAVADVEPGTPMMRVNTAQIAGRIITIRQLERSAKSRSGPRARRML